MKVNTAFQMDIHDGTTLVEPLPPWELNSAMSYIRLGIEVLDDGRLQEERISMQLWEVDIQGRLVISTGQYQSLAARLRRLGYRVTINDHRQFDSRFTTDESVCEEANLGEEALLRAVKAEPRGTIDVETDKALIASMALLIRYYRHARVLVLAATNSRVRDIRWHLAEELGEVVNLRLPGREPPKTRIVVSTFRPMPSEEEASWDLILLPDLADSTGDIATFYFAGSRGHVEGQCSRRIYGFLRRGQKLTRRTELRMECMAGPCILRVHPRRVGIQLLCIETPSCRKIGCAGGVEFKQEAYWQNQRRNEFATSVAKGFATGNIERLNKYGVKIRHGTPVIRGGSKPEVTILVESQQHAQELAERLPGWSVHALQRRPHPHSDQRMRIMTVSAAAEYGLAGDVIVIASGELTPEVARGFPPERETVVDDDVLVVDFTDNFDQVAERRARDRVAAGIRHGWCRY